MPKNHFNHKKKMPWYQSAWNWTRHHVLIILLPAGILGINRFWYLLARLITHTMFTNGSQFFEWDIPFDHQIPMVSAFVIPYMLSYFYWLIIPFFIYAYKGRKSFYVFCSAALVAEVIGFLWLIILPSKMSYADYSKSVQDLNEHSDILSTLLKNLVYKADLPDNLCPSFHIIATILACIICCRKDENEKHHYGMLFTTIIAVILVALATLFTRQHYIVDILVAFVICEISYLIAQKFNWGAHFGKIMGIINLKIGIVKQQDSPLGKESSKYLYRNRAEQVIVIIVFILLVGVAIYFGAVSLLTGDPFKGIWKWGINDLYPGQPLIPLN